MTDKHVCRDSFKCRAYSNPVSSPVSFLSIYMMATLRTFYLDNHQTNETILVYGGSDDGATTSVRFHQLGRSREEIIAEYAPDLTPWLLKYLPPSIQPGDDLTTKELAACYQRNLAALHAPLLAGPEGGEERVQHFERIRKKTELCVVGALRLCHGIDMERDKHRVAVSHFGKALEAHRNGHVAIFLEVAAGQHIAIPVESAWIMLEAARDARPHKWMYARDEPEALRTRWPPL